MKHVQNFLLSCILSIIPLAAFSESPPQDAEQYRAWATDLWNSMERKQGEIRLSNGVATLKVPEPFYYLNPADAKRVLVDIWGNPPDQNVLGMLFPTGTTPFDRDAWGVTIEYEADGYVSDKDAAGMDYSNLLKEMQHDVLDANKERQKQGFESITLVGWAEPPHYDQATHKLYWAKELKFGNDPEHTLNYNIRMLGKQGVLVLNFIAGMPQKPVIESNLEQVLAMANFDQGNRYDEFDPSLDKVAAYGIGGLIAGKVIAKTGLIAAALLFLKKFGVIAIVAITAAARKLFGRKAN